MKRERSSRAALDQIPDLPDSQPEKKEPAKADRFRNLCKILSEIKGKDTVINVPMEFIAQTENIRGAVRKDEKFDSLKASILHDGLIHPVVIQLINDKPVLVAGYRRFAACEAIGMVTIPATGKPSETDWKIVQIMENIQRVDIPGIKFAESVKELKSRYPEDTMTQLAHRLGIKSREVVGWYLKAADWPDEAKADALDKDLSRGAILQIARKKESSEPTALPEMMETQARVSAGEKKEALQKQPSPDSKILNDVLKQKLILSGATKNGQKSLFTLADKLAALQPEIRRTLARCLLEMDEPEF